MVERSSDLWTQALVPNWSYSQQRLQPGYCQLENPHLPKCRQLHWSLECSRVKLQSKRLHRSKKEGRPPIDTSKTSNHEKVGVFIQALGDALPGPQSADPSQRWEYMRGTTLPCLPSARLVDMPWQHTNPHPASVKNLQALWLWQCERYIWWNQAGNWSNSKQI